MINLKRSIVYRGDVYNAIEGERIDTLYGVLNDKYMDGFHDGLKRALLVLSNDVKDIPTADLVERKPAKTNADKYFRNATDEELVAWLCDHVDCRYCPAEKTGCLDGYTACGDAWLEWLKQEVQDAAD
jgi:hypothetical protein